MLLLHAKIAETTTKYDTSQFAVRTKTNSLLAAYENYYEKQN